MHLGAFEVVVILAVVLVLFGPTLLPRLGRRAGASVKALREAGDEAIDNAREAAGTATETAKAAASSAADQAKDAAGAAASKAAENIKNGEGIFGDMDEYDGIFRR